MGGKRQGREKGEGGREGGAWGGERKEGRGMEGISLLHGRLKTLAALSTLSTRLDVGHLLMAARIDCR